MKPSVYLETSVISYLAAHPSRDLVTAARQQVTHEWWRWRRNDFDLYVSELVHSEASAGDADAASQRLGFLPLLNRIVGPYWRRGERRNMEGRLPQRTHIYQNHTLDSTRWDDFSPREDDIVIATPFKSGTTWMQAIVGGLVLPGDENPIGASPWLDHYLVPLGDVIAKLDGQTHRRFLKTHLPLDGLPYYPTTKYIFVGRNRLTGTVEVDETHITDRSSSQIT